MKIIKASHEIINYTPNLEQSIEAAGRVCYKSEDKATDDSAAAFIERIKNFKHESVLEHGAITVRFIVDRGVSHELVRHRLASFSQESTRYCNYGKDKFGKEITVIEPCFWDRSDLDCSGFSDDGYVSQEWTSFLVWKDAMLRSEKAYFELIRRGATPQQARSVLPNSLKTEVVMTANPREWRHVIAVRGHRDAHPSMIEVIRPMAIEFAQRWPALFADVAKELQ